MSKHIITRQEEASDRRGLDVIDLASTFVDNYPILAAYVTQERYPEGGFRQTSTLLFFVERGQLKVCLSDREGHRSLFRASNSIDGCLEALEQALANDTADWKMKRI